MLVDILWLLAAAVLAVVAFQRQRMPSSLGYLLVGIALGPHALGLLDDTRQTRALAEFGIVFLLFTIGLNYSLPQLLAMRHQVFGLGTAQVAFTTAVVAVLAWIAGLPPAAAFVIGAVFAQSSTTLISKQLAEQGETDSRHGRLGVAMSVFQDVTAVPFVVVIPVLGTAAAASLVGPLAIALLEAIAAFALILVVGRRLLRPVFHEVAARRSPELFTLTVLLVTLAAAAVTQALGLSMALGAFLAGMVLGDTEFRHQVESAIRPFRDVLLGLFFVTIGMLADPAALPAIWHWAILNALGLLLAKALLVAAIVRLARIDVGTAVRTGIVLAVGGEFGFALLSIALSAEVISPHHAQIALASVLFSMIAGAFFIRFNGAIARHLVPRPVGPAEGLPQPGAGLLALRDHVIVCGYGRIGQNVGRFLEEEGIPYVALDLEPSRVRAAHASGLPVYYGDSAERDILEALGASAARLVVISHDDLGAARRTLQHLRSLEPAIPVMVRARDESHAEELLSLGATEVVPETLESALMIASHVLLLAGVDPARVVARMREAQANRYQLLRQYFGGAGVGAAAPGEQDATLERLHSVSLGPGAAAIGRRLGDVLQADVQAQTLVRGGNRQLAPDPDTMLQEDDVVVLFGPGAAVARASGALLGRGVGSTGREGRR